MISYIQTKIHHINFLHDSLFKNAFFLMLSSISTAGFGFIFWFLAAKFYSASDVGIATGIMSSMTLIVNLSRFGLDYSIIRFFPTHDKCKVFSTSTVISTLIALIFGLIFISGINSFSPELSFLRSPLYTLFYFISLTSSSVIFTAGIFFVAIREAEFQLYLNLIVGSRVLFVILFISLGAIGIFYAVGASFFIAFLISLVLILKSGTDLKLKIDRKFLTDSFNFSAGNFLTGLFMTVPNTLLPIMILNMHLVEQAAYYYIVFGIVSLLFMIPESISTSLFVEGSNGQSLKKTVIQSLVIIFLLLTPIALFFYLYGSLILGFIGQDYVAGGSGVFRLMIFASFFVVVNNVYFAIKRIQKDTKEITLLSGIIFILLIGLAFLLIPVLGIEGIGYAWIISYGTGALIILIQVFRKARFQNLLIKAM
ncbi:oligosaccharide flippase family protein [Methanosarcina mazei]|uniref:oligosaccharide flippase family protein n=1 Tax=Methanosarcina mazei TaxID=2209 RepID=UPI0025520E8F|nr:oligosaccharide flippase family protein [Methanosarcina mazei]WIM44851.1 oligosaccharide flippase family protein [Methanosarcina mazei]WIM48309.1 oligosaccharide flippase family protein [Methanosarcina mazei]